MVRITVVFLTETMGQAFQTLQSGYETKEIVNINNLHLDVAC
jgi:hypothetical protein